MADYDASIGLNVTSSMATDEIVSACSRCDKFVFLPPAPATFEMSSIYWGQFANPGEVLLCASCLYADYRYIAAWGGSHFDSNMRPC
jgi:hypothetical protein